MLDSGRDWMSGTDAACLPRTGADMTKRMRRKDSPTFKTEVASAAIKRGNRSAKAAKSQMISDLLHRPRPHDI